MKRIVAMSVASAMLACLPAMASAAWDDFDEDPQSDISSVLELRLGRYEPSIDDEFGGTGAYSEVFDSSPMMFEAAYERQLYRGFGSAAVGVSAGWAKVTGTAVTADGTSSPEDTRLLVAPLRLSGVYRFDYLQRRFRVPLVLALEGGLTYAFWSAKSQNGVSDVTTDSGESLVGRGGTYGMHYAVGLHLLLDVFSPNMARGFDRNIGVNNSYAFAQYRSSQLDDFGSATSWDLSDKQVMFGLAFEF